MRAILDTSVFIAREQERPLGELPDEVAVSVVTLSELRHGVLAAAGHEQMARRLSTMEIARQIAKPLAIDEVVGDEMARLRVALKALGRTMMVMDAWIAATAMAHGAAVCTQDADFDAAHEAGLLEVVWV
ncbi:MAG TPA: PIN domain-containing protein [Solirubrobacterales bacterium]